MVTAFQDLCLGAPLSDVLLLLPLECVVRDTTTTIKKKKKKTGRSRKEQRVLWVTFPKSDKSLLSRKLSILETHWTDFRYQSNQTVTYD